jgi:hypothetical protein
MVARVDEPFMIASQAAWMRPPLPGGRRRRKAGTSLGANPPAVKRETDSSSEAWSLRVPPCALLATEERDSGAGRAAGGRSRQPHFRRRRGLVEGHTRHWP